jgi:hypothetical protein
MRGVLTGVRRGGVLLVLVATLATSAGYAQETNLSDPPGAIIAPPIGVVSQEAAAFVDVFFAWLQAIIRPPIG